MRNQSSSKYQKKNNPDNTATKSLSPNQSLIKKGKIKRKEKIVSEKQEKIEDPQQFKEKKENLQKEESSRQGNIKNEREVQKREQIANEENIFSRNEQNVKQQSNSQEPLPLFNKKELKIKFKEQSVKINQEPLKRGGNSPLRGKVEYEQFYSLNQGLISQIITIFDSLAKIGKISNEENKSYCKKLKIILKNEMKIIQQHKVRSGVIEKLVQNLQQQCRCHEKIIDGLRKQLKNSGQGKRKKQK